MLIFMVKMGENNNNSERIKYHVVISKQTKDKIKVAESIYLRHHPEMKGFNITNNHIILQSLNYYIEH